MRTTHGREVIRLTLGARLDQSEIDELLFTLAEQKGKETTEKEVIQ